jgi:hypothetical protein
MHDTTPSPVSKSLIYGLIGVILVGSGMLYYRLYMKPTVSEPKPVPPKAAPQGSLKLIPEGNRTVYKEGEDVTLVLSADSAGQSIAGFDAVFDTSTTDAKLVTVEGLAAGFKIFSNQESDFISITAVQDEQLPTEKTFQNEPIARLTFTPQHSGKNVLNFRFTPGETSDANLVNLVAEDILGKVEGATIYVGTHATLTAKTPIAIQPGTALQLEKIIQPAATCADCLTEVYTQLVQTASNGTAQKERVVFSFGGLAGVTADSTSAGGFIFTASNLTDTSLDITYAVEPVND